jgi:hypothetical protein
LPEWQEFKFKKIKVMKNQDQKVQELFEGYANGFITDQECNDMLDLLLGEITKVVEVEHDYNNY